ncbi:MAG: YbhB/YbcL family Raf kinase inhibitor-like protein [Cryobacterium sp.]|nr:YbhB/YbcL family Raf kinase inhibitor-like protein [Cryobacterium sp.]
MANDPNWRLPEVPAFSLTSPDFTHGGQLPAWSRGSGEGAENRSPALSWEGAPAGTASYVLTMFDPDAPTSSGWWHWAVAGIPATVASLPQDAGNPATGLLPGAAVTIANEARVEAYGGAAPPPGHGEHRYYFTVSALDTERLDVPEGATPAMLSFLMRPHVIARAQLMGVTETPA